MKRKLSTQSKKITKYEGLDQIIWWQKLQNFATIISVDNEAILEHFQLMGHRKIYSIVDL